MTKWIDEFADSLGEDARRANAQRQHDLMREGLIQEHGPAFFDKFKAALRAQSSELNDRLVGTSYKGVTASDDRNPASILVRSQNGASSLTCTVNYKARKMVTQTARTGSLSNAPKVRDFILCIDTDEPRGVWLRSEDGAQEYRDPAELATKLLREAFTGKWE